MSNDRELMELAAKAAGYVLTGHTQKDWAFCHGGVEWNPLANDGDALRLAVRLDMCFGIAPHRVSTDKVSLALAPGGTEAQQKHNDDPYAATRRAIVRAAAEIGRNMK